MGPVTLPEGIGNVDDFWLIVAIAFGTALASPLGGLIAVMFPPTTLVLSIAVGAAGGILVGTLAFEMVPTALQSLPLALVVVGIVLGTGLTYGLDLIVNRGRVAGESARQKRAVEAYHRVHRPLGTGVTVLAAATAVEELIEGLTIGVGGTIGMDTAIIMALAIFVDNISEALSIGALAHAESRGRYKRRTLIWTSTIGASLFVAATAGLILLQSLSQGVLAFLLSIGAGSMFYLTITDLVPEAEEHQYQQSAGLAATVGFLVALVFAQTQ